MNFGVLKEDRRLERRVALSPAGVQSLTAAGNRVFVEQHAGLLSMFNDTEYVAAGAVIVYSAEETIARSQVVLKISPPTNGDLSLLGAGQVFFSAFHLVVSDRKITEGLLAKKTTAITYELIEDNRGSLPVLQAMSEIGGQLSIQVAAHFLQGEEGGRGILLGGIPGIPPASVVILGAGTVGRTAARVALGVGAAVTVLDSDLSRLREIEHHFHWKVATALATDVNVARAVQFADVVIGAVLLKGARAPHVVSEEMVKTMKAGSVIVDVAIDQGGCIETSRPTTIDDPVFIEHGVVHFCVPNMPAMVSRTATVALTNAILPYLHSLGESGIEHALRLDPGFAKGACTFNGFCTNRTVSNVFKLPYKDLQIHLASVLPSSQN
ncbi:MAG: alanine dehydrogenase [Bacteroidota bacterium]|nr:alanine dehydrogenase [Bacteroidota bacterium]